MIKSRLPLDSVTSFTQRQRFLDAMDNRLRRLVEPQLTDADSWMQMVEKAERYDATMFKTGAYGKTEHKTNKPKHGFNNSKEKDKTTFKKEKKKSTSKNTKTSKKPSKAEMERRKKDGACFYCGEKGHMANDCPKKEIKTNRVAEDSDSKGEDDDEEEEDSGDEQSSTEEVFVGMILHSAKTTATSENSAIPFQALEANRNINRHQAQVMFDTGTIGTDLLLN